jgi:BMFP domain-containing protein YqiC
MQSENRFFDDAAKLAGGAIGSLAGIRREIEALARQQVERLLARMDLVTRDEFEAVKEMAAKARAEQEDLTARLDVLEAAAKPRAKPKKTTSDPETGKAES